MQAPHRIVEQMEQLKNDRARCHGCLCEFSYTGCEWGFSLPLLLVTKEEAKDTKPSLPNTIST